MRDDHGDDPMLIRPDGSAVETWRENYPYDELMSRNDYEVEKYLLQIELLKFQYWAQDNARKHVIVFEGRDAAGKGGTIKRFMEHLNPRSARVVALTKPTIDRAGSVVLPAVRLAPAHRRGDRALRPVLVQPGGGRAGDGLLRRGAVPDLHEAGAGVRAGCCRSPARIVTKLWFSVTQQEQRTRFAIRQIDPVRRWKLSPMDLESLDKWEAYTEAKEAMLLTTDTEHAPWHTIKSNDKKRARINALRLFLSLVDYDGKDDQIVLQPDPLIVQRGRHTVGD